MLSMHLPNCVIYQATLIISSAAMQYSHVPAGVSIFKRSLQWYLLTAMNQSYMTAVIYSSTE